MPDQSSNQHMLPMNVAPGQNVKPSVVVKISPAADFSVLTSGISSATEVPFGIAQNWTKGAPGTPYNDGFVSTPDDPSVMIWGPGSIAVAGLKDNAPAIAPGKSVGADAQGELVEITVAGNWAVGWLLESGTALKSQKLRVFVHPHKV